MAKQEKAPPGFCPYAVEELHAPQSWLQVARDLLAGKARPVVGWEVDYTPCFDLPAQREAMSQLGYIVKKYGPLLHVHKPEEDDYQDHLSLDGGWSERLSYVEDDFPGAAGSGWRTTRQMTVTVASFRTWPGYRRCRPPPAALQM